MLKSWWSCVKRKIFYLEDYAISSVYLIPSFCAGVLQADFIETECYDWAYQLEELLVVMRSRIRIPDHFFTSRTITE